MLKRYYTLSIVLYPILSAYTLIGPIDLGVALCGLIAGLMFVSGRGKIIKCPKGWKAFLIYVFIGAILITHAIPARIILYTFILVIGCGVCKLNVIYRYYSFVAKICIMFFLFQEFVRIITGVNIPGIITFLPTVYGDSAGYIASNIIGSDRSSSFFLEPSYFAQFLFPLVVLELFWNNENTSIRNAVILTFITLLIRSGNGILLLGIIWISWFFCSDIKKQTKRYIVIGVGGLMLIAVSLLPGAVSEMLNRSSELSLSGADNRWHSSGFIRFWRGYFLYALFPTLNKIFGMNPTALRYFMEYKSMGLFSQDIDAAFINGIQTILCYYGAIGLILVLRHLWLIQRHSTLAVKVMIICTLYLLLSESYFICGRMLVVIIVSYLLKNSVAERIPIHLLTKLKEK